MSKNKNDSLKDSGKTKSVVWWLPAIKMSLRLSGWIIIPILAGIGAGRWLDMRYGTRPWLFLVCVGAAFFISMIAIVYYAYKEFKNIN